ncbi:MAG: hypothetical protein ABIS35_02455 [Terracoccus sp.]
MEPEAEQRALADVRSRLQQRFPHVDAAIIEAAVRLAHAELTGRVRDFVPVLVEHVARDRLSFVTVDAPSKQEPA